MKTVGCVQWVPDGVEVCHSMVPVDSFRPSDGRSTERRNLAIDRYTPGGLEIAPTHCLPSLLHEV